MTGTKILEVIEDVEFRYPEDEGVSYIVPAGLVLHRGEAWCIRGVSGSGKSTLMTLLAALRRFIWGEVAYSFEGEPPVTVSPESWRHRVGPGLWRRIGFAFQRPELIRALDVTDNLALVAGNGAGASLFGDQEWERIAHSRVWEISGGQIQRLGLMRAFGADQYLVFLDEPTNNLDRRNRAAVADYVARLRRGRGLVVVSHDDEFIDTLEIDRVHEIRETTAPDGGLRRSLTEIHWPEPSPETTDDVASDVTRDGERRAEEG